MCCVCSKIVVTLCVKYSLKDKLGNNVEFYTLPSVNVKGGVNSVVITYY